MGRWQSWRRRRRDRRWSRFSSPSRTGNPDVPDAGAIVALADQEPHSRAVRAIEGAALPDRNGLRHRVHHLLCDPPEPGTLGTKASTNRESPQRGRASGARGRGSAAAVGGAGVVAAGRAEPDPLLLV